MEPPLGSALGATDAPVEGRSPDAVLLLTGTVGAGKSTVASEVNDVLAERQVPNAVIDLESIRKPGHALTRARVAAGPSRATRRA
ncbi:MAG: adenylyl-sulfate kinase [Acidimicrobiia bacterium]